MAKIVDIAEIPETTGSRYPAPHDAPCATRANRRLAVAVDIDQFGVNLTRLPPGAWSSQRHWHTHEDELVYVLSGLVVLIDDDGEHELGTGAVVGFKAGDGNGHHFVNRSAADAVFVAVGSRSIDDVAWYPDIGMKTSAERYGPSGSTYRHADGSPWSGPSSAA